MKQTDTPRTDEANRKWQMSLHDYEFARQLEREINQWRACAGDLRHACVCRCGQDCRTPAIERYEKLCEENP